MRRSAKWMLASLVAIGCGGKPPEAAPEPPKATASAAPRKGDKVIAPEIADLWEAPQFLRRQAEIEKERGLKPGDPDLAALAKFRGPVVWKGDLLEVLEVADDCAGVVVLRRAGKDGDDDRPHGYIRAWWK